MKIIVCLKEVVDTALSLDTGLRHRLVFREGLPLRLNPADIKALEIALDIHSRDTSAGSSLTAVSIGPERVEKYLRQALSLGADNAVRIWARDMHGLSPYQKARLLHAYVSLHAADLVLLGTASLDTANGQVGQMLAARLNWPGVSGVTALEIDNKTAVLKITRDVGQGRREIIEADLPAVVAVKGEPADLPYASLDSLIESQQAEVEILSPADLAVTPAALKVEPARITGLMAPRPRPHRVTTPDSSLPAFYRVLKLLEGGLAKRQGKMLQGTTEELAEQLYQLLIDEGVIGPAADV
jgi:electron transfer flavoprotein beta subunit